ncbi:class I SAM-dependent methyltransferase [Streptomyces sp. NPDC091371]|uniref:class I SAM-dependent methyltransferase n=1 Tax=Streptomyces sp. NPDC091371 TaxID=3155303 RepID=UPI00342E94B8
MPLLPDITAFYGGGDEAARLTSGRTIDTLELVRTQELLRGHLPPAPASILDVGGGPGAHARWLTGDGHRVVVVDPVEHHVRQAHAQGLAAFVGDARQLGHLPDTSYDAVLLLGPLYHLPDAVGRAQAWQEAARLVRVGGLVAAAALNRYLKVQDLGADDGLEVAKTGLLVRPNGPTTYYHEPAELQEEAGRAGLSETRVYGVQGPASAAVKARARHTGSGDLGQEALERALAAARFADGHPELAVTSLHLLALARRRPAACDEASSGRP